ncbi:GBF-interacting protein 1-like isoform X2 [Jatropha curcas]|uniref:GBF-interacting protein 1-like isoform X2 n=1 Tax=Jatropha curcas TaxID=180498 RepID=UPI0005FB1F74|nr:GBF-interacting protein 1-like isoform X2 [Jatropha curcas]
MSNSSGGGGAARVTIPESVRKTIQSIREITGKQHSDEDIYSVLTDCSMDPNDTAQKLLYLDTFHEVKRKRERKKEMPGTQGRGARGGRGNHSANHAYPDAVGVRNAAPRRENGATHMTERAPSTAGQKTNNKAVTEIKASTVTPNGPSSLPNGGSSLGHSPESPARGVVHSTKDGSDIDKKKPGTALLPTPSSPATNQISEHMIQVQQGKPASSSNDQPTSTISASVPGVYSSASDPVLAPTMTWISGTIGAIKQEVGSQQRAAGSNQIQGNNLVSDDVGSELPKNEISASTIIHSVIKRKVPGKSANEKPESSETLQPSLPADDTSLAVGSSSSSQDSDIPSKVSSEDAHTDDSSCLLPVQTVTNGHVTFPNHFKVPEALKSGLTFGSFDVNSGPGTKNCNGNSCDINSTHATESSHGTDETARETSSSNQSISSTVLVDHPDQLESPEQVFENATKSEGIATSDADPKSNKASQEMMLLPEGQQNSVVQIAPSYGFGIVSTVPGGQLVQIEGYESQTQDVSCLSGFVSENPMASSIPSPSPSPPVQNSVAVSPQPMVFRPPYPPSYFPYGHFFNPYFIPPMHQFLSHNGLAQQPSTGNAYLTPTATAPAPGVKFPFQQFKPGTSTGNPTPIGMQPIYGSYGSSPVSFNPVPAVTSGSPASNEDVSASQLKESQIYTTGPLNDGSAWISPPGQELSSLHLNSLYHITPQGQHLAFSPAQAGHGPFPGIYPPVQAIAAAPSTVNPHLQQPQAVSAAVETSAHPSSAYQQTHLGQINWNSY